MESRHHQVSQSEIEAGHAPTDVRGRGFIIFLVAFVLVAVVLHVALWWLYGAMARKAPMPPPSPLADVRTPPPEPRLQGSAAHPALAAQDLAAMLAREQAQLNGYGWANRELGQVHIPIEKAMTLLLEKGLPTRGPATQTQPE